jgi:hypothetical protein
LGINYSIFLFLFFYLIFSAYFIYELKAFFGDWGLGIGDWGLGIGDWAQSPIPNPQSPIPNPQKMLLTILFKFILNTKYFFKYIKINF